MRSADTDDTTDRVHLDLLRRVPPGRRLELALSLSSTVVGLSRRGMARSHPGSSQEELAIRFVQMSYGDDLARELRAFLLRRAS